MNVVGVGYLKLHPEQSAGSVSPGFVSQRSGRIDNAAVAATISMVPSEYMRRNHQIIFLSTGFFLIVSDISTNASSVGWNNDITEGK